MERRNDDEQNSDRITFRIYAQKRSTLKNNNMTDNYRESEFRIGSVHGKTPDQSMREAQLRNYLYGAGTLVIEYSRTKFLKIRIVGYEVPIWKRGKSRDECIDLIGYDKSHTPWIIELKKEKSSEGLEEVIPQINRYVTAFEEGIRAHIQKEVSERFLWPDFSFSGEAKRMILAGRSFFEKQESVALNLTGIEFCSFARCASEETLLKTPRAEVALKIERF